MIKRHSIIAVLALFALAKSSPAQNIDLIEYFIDVDPGVGMGTQIAPTLGSTINETVAVPVATIAALSDGNHLLVCRVRDSDGDWSVAFARTFLKSNVAIDNTVPDIVGGEYFFDIDPGQGNGTQFNVTAGTTVDLTVDIPAVTIAALPDGFHSLATRVQDADGDWSAAFTRVFLKMADPPPPPPEVLMQRIDYRWLVGGVPVGNEILLLPGAPAKVILFTELASLAGLQQEQNAVLEVTPYDTMGIGASPPTPPS